MLRNYLILRNNLKRRTQLRERKLLGITRARSKTTNDRALMIFPKNIKVAVVRNKENTFISLYIYNEMYCYNFNIELCKLLSVRFYNDANTLFMLFNKRYPFFDLGIAHIYKLLKILHTAFLQRLRVKGRLYRIYKRNIYRDIQYRFGHTHKMIVYTEGLYVKYIRKKKIRIFGYDYYYLTNKLKEIRDVYPVNIYTKLGIRVGGERSYNRIGKTVKYY